MEKITGLNVTPRLCKTCRKNECLSYGNNMCRECYREYRKNYYNNNKDKYKKYFFNQYGAFRGRYLYFWEVLSQGNIHYAGSTKNIAQRHDSHSKTRYATDFAKYITKNKIPKDDLQCYVLDLSSYKDVTDDDMRLLERYMIQNLKENNPLINDKMTKTTLFPNEIERIEDLLGRINTNNFVLYEELYASKIAQKNTYPSVSPDDKSIKDAV